MYAVVATGGKQYRVEAGTTLEVERLAGDPGASVTFDRVLMIADGDAVTIGTPVVTGASVVGTVLGNTLGPKLVIFKFKQKVKYRRRTGHRQGLTRVRIDAIHATAAAPRKRAAAKATVDQQAAKPKATTRKATAPTAAADETTDSKKAAPRRAARPKAKE